MADGFEGGDLGRPGTRAGVCVSVYDPQVADEICSRVAKGQSLRSICSGDDGMPHRTTLPGWARAHPEFGRALQRAERTARTQVRVSDRIKAEIKRAAPKPKKGGRPSTYRRKIAETICRRLTEGETLISIVKDPAMPCYGTVYKWLKHAPEFEEMYVQARQIMGDYLFDEARDVAKAATPEGVWVSRLQFDVIRWQTARLAPRKYCEALVARTVLLEAAELAKTPREMKIRVVDFKVAKDGRVFAIPPRNPKEREMYEAEFGFPYEETLW